MYILSKENGEDNNAVLTMLLAFVFNRRAL